MNNKSATDATNRNLPVGDLRGAENWREISLSGTEWRVAHFLPGECNPTVDVIKRIAGGEEYGPDWIPALVPGDVQSDAIDAGLLPDINYGLNSRLAEWTCQRDWVYHRKFAVAKPGAPVEDIILQFDGVDYSCDIFLNHIWLGHHEGAWTAFEYNITALLNYSEINSLIVVVEHAPDEQCQWGRTSKVKTVKSRFAYGWDWSTRLVPLGIWKDVRLVTRGKAYITDVWVRTDVDPQNSQARITIETSLTASDSSNVNLKYSLTCNERIVCADLLSSTLETGSNKVKSVLDVVEPKLWYPNGYGPQPLYRLECVLTDNAGNVLDVKNETIGLRSMKWIHNDNAPDGSIPYLVEVNGIKIFIKGWNWSPVRQLYGREHRDVYHRRLVLAKEANCTFLRVNAVGLVEREYFYDLCDELGILVWQDLLQSSSAIDNHPSNEPSFRKLLMEQAEQIVPKYRNHPSLALWCGGNELCVRGDVVDECGHVMRPEAAGYEGYRTSVDGMEWRPLSREHPLLAAVGECMHKLDPDRHWLHTSASGPSENAFLGAPGQMHDVHGPWRNLGPAAHYGFYNKVDMLLHSEFGCDGAASVQSMEKFVPEEYSWPMDHTNPVAWHHGRMWSASNLQRTEEFFGKINDPGTYVRASQHIQAEGLRYAMEAHRRRQWQCSGGLIWHMAEPFPNVCDTCSVDYFNQPKPSYYAVAKANRMVHVSMKYDSIVWAHKPMFSADIWLHNSTGDGIKAKLVTAIWTISGERMASREDEVDMKPGSSEKWGTIDIDTKHLPEELFLLRSTLMGESGDELSDHWSVHSLAERAPLEGLRSLRSGRVSAGSDHSGIHLRNDGPVAVVGLWLEPGLNDRISVSDNWLCLMPDETRHIGINGEWKKLKISAWNLETGEIES